MIRTHGAPALHLMCAVCGLRVVMRTSRIHGIPLEDLATLRAAAEVGGWQFRQNGTMRCYDHAATPALDGRHTLEP